MVCFALIADPLQWKDVENTGKCRAGGDRLVEKPGGSCKPVAIHCWRERAVY